MAKIMSDKVNCTSCGDVYLLYGFDRLRSEDFVCKLCRTKEAERLDSKNFPTVRGPRRGIR